MNQKLISLLHSVKRIIIWLLLFSIIFTFFVNPWAISPYTNELKKVRDEYRLQNSNEIINSLENLTTFEFKSINDFNLMYNKDLNDPKTCYYLSSTEKKDSYILAISFESSKFKKKYWNEYYLFKSDSNYIIDENKINEIKNIIKFPCKDKSL